MGDAETRLVEVATRLFAELGFDGTSTRLIAEAAGIEVDELVERVGDKTELYRTVMAHAHEAEQAAMRSALADFTPTMQGLLDLADAYLDFYVDHPEILSLWMHRWLGDAIDVERLEEEYARPLYVMVTDLVRDLIPPDVDADHMVWTVVWSVYGFLTGGMQYSRGAAVGGRGERPWPSAQARPRGARPVPGPPAHADPPDDHAGAGRLTAARTAGSRPVAGPAQATSL